MSWAEHAASIEAANEKIDLVQQTLSALIVQSQRAATAVAMATGGNACLSDSGREAFEMAAAFEDNAREMLNRAVLCRNAMVNYRNGV
jgi:hypothetical protein